MRLEHAPLLPNECGDDEGSRRQHRPDPPCPPRGAAVGEREDDQEDTESTQQHPDRIGSERMLRTTPRHEQQRHNDKYDSDRHIHEKDAAPAHTKKVDRDEPATEDQSPDGPQRAQCSNDAQDRGALLRRVHHLHAGEHLGHHDPGEPALKRAGRDEQVACLGQCCPEGGEGESHHPDHEHAPVPEDIAQSTARDEKRREGDDVTGESPLQLLRCRIEVLADRGQCDVGDR